MRLLGLALLVLLSTGTACETIEATGGGGDEEYFRDNDRVAQEELRDYEVILYEHTGFRGRDARYVLQRDQRHVLVEFVGWGINDRVSSIHLGRNVGIALFRDRDFRGPIALYDRSTDRVDQDINDWTSSAIIFDLDAGGPLGAWLGNGGGNEPDVLDTDGFHGQARFYPLPESLDYREGEYDYLRDFNDQAEWVILGPVSPQAFRRSTYRERAVYDRDRGRTRYGDDYRRSGTRGYVDVEVFLYEHDDFRGRSVAFPERYSRNALYMLKEHDFNRIASSMAIREIVSRRR